MNDSRCRGCGGSRLDAILDLGVQVPATRFLRPDQTKEVETRYPLELVGCGSCGLLQLTSAVPSEIRHATLGVNAQPDDLLHDHARRLARSLCSRFAIARSDLVIDLGSGDGTVLRAFQRPAMRVVGIEPRVELSARTGDDGVLCHVGPFDCSAAQALRERHGPARLLITRHGLNAAADPIEFTSAIHQLLAEDGIAAIELIATGAIYQDLAFNAITHDHPCYFSLANLRELLARHELELIDVERSAVASTTWVHAARVGGPYRATARVAAALRQEKALGLNDLDTWRGFARRVAQWRVEFRWFIAEATRTGHLVAGYGATPEANALLAYADLDADAVAFLVDPNPRWHGWVTPGHHLPIFGPEALRRERPDVVLLLAQDQIAGITSRHVDYQMRGGRFAVPIPEPRLYGLLGIAA